MKKTLAELRNEKGLTQRELAANLSSYEEGLHFSPATIALYELGARTPRLPKAVALARYFGVSIEDISFGPCACKSQVV